MGPIKLSYEEIYDSFANFRKDFFSKPIEPFYNIEIRPAYKKGATGLMTVTNYKRWLRGLPYIHGPLLPDESEYIAVICVSGVGPNIKPYTFKIRDDGAFMYSIPFEYNKQPISKWVKYMNNFIRSLPTFGPYYRQQMRTSAFKHELIQTCIEQDFHNVLISC